MRMRHEVEHEKNELNMTSMIDIVFLLLVFFSESDFLSLSADLVLEMFAPELER